MIQKTQVAIGLGSNLGDRCLFLRRAAKRLCDDLLEEARSASVYESLPWQGRLQPAYLNSVVVGITEWKPPAVVNFLKNLERELGRFTDEKYASRVIDLDLLCYGGEHIELPGLSVPHPHLSERDFVLLPLKEVWPDWKHPLLEQTPEEMLGVIEKSTGRLSHYFCAPLF